MSKERNCWGCDEQKGEMKISTSALTAKMFFEVTSIASDGQACLCRSCQQELKQSYIFRRRCHEIAALYGIDTSTMLQPARVVEEVFVPEFSQQEQNTPKRENADSSEIYIEEFQERLSRLSEQGSDWAEEVPPSPARSQDSTNQEFDETGKAIFKCRDCPKTYLKKSLLVFHQMSHKNLRNFVCEHAGCRSAFNILPRLVRHLRNLHSASETEILEIRAKHSTPGSRARRIKTKMRNENEDLRSTCEICNKVLASPKYLKEHMTLQHLNDAPFICDFKDCGKKFVDYSLLNKHMNKHQGKFDYICQYCDKGYVERKLLVQHLKCSHQVTQKELNEMHRIESFCQECQKDYKTPALLGKHQAMEHGVGDLFICDMCGKAFVSRMRLISHQNYHKEVKNLKCLKCPSYFHEVKGLKHHMRQVHKMTEKQFYKSFK